MTINVEVSPAKINLTLQVEGLRDDGLRNLTSLVAFSHNCLDIVSLKKGTKTKIFRSGPYAKDLPSKQNCLSYKALVAWQKYHKIFKPVEITLNKVIPLASGLGGGSSNAAAVIRALDHKFKKNTPISLCFKLGADVPACYYSKSLWMEKAGESITTKESLTLSNERIAAIIAVPDQQCSTEEIFQKLDKQNNYKKLSHKPILKNLDELCDFCRSTGNSFEKIILKEYPAINKALTIIRGHKDIQYASISGTGSSIFGICKNPKKNPQDTAQELKTIFLKEKINLRYLNWSFLF